MWVTWAGAATIHEEVEVHRAPNAVRPLKPLTLHIDLQNDESPMKGLYVPDELLV